MGWKARPRQLHWLRYGRKEKQLQRGVDFNPKSGILALAVMLALIPAIDEPE